MGRGRHGTLADKFAGLLPRLGIGLEHRLYTARRNRFVSRKDGAVHTGQITEFNVSGKKRFDRDLIRRVQCGRRRAAELQRIECQVKTRKSLRVGFLKTQI